MFVKGCLKCSDRVHTDRDPLGMDGARLGVLKQLDLPQTSLSVD